MRRYRIQARRDTTKYEDAVRAATLHSTLCARQALTRGIKAIGHGVFH